MWFTHKNILLLTSGDSTGLSAEVIAGGRLWLILTEVIALLVMASMVAACAYSSCRNYGNHLSVHLTIYDFLLCGRTCKPLLWCSFTVLR